MARTRSNREKMSARAESSSGVRAVHSNTAEMGIGVGVHSSTAEMLEIGV